MAEPRARRAYIALGSNIDKERNIVAAVELLAAAARVVAVSSVYETAPVGDTDQDDFLNAVAVVEAAPPREDLRRVLAAIEDRLGRVRTENKNAPRTIDLDIVLILDPHAPRGETTPDPEALTRAHVAVPLAEVLPDYTVPGTGEPLDRIAGRLAAGGGIARRTDLDLWRVLR